MFSIEGGGRWRLGRLGLPQIQRGWGGGPSGGGGGRRGGPWDSPDLKGGGPSRGGGEGREKTRTRKPEVELAQVGPPRRSPRETLRCRRATPRCRGAARRCRGATRRCRRARRRDVAMRSAAMPSAAIPRRDAPRRRAAKVPVMLRCSNAATPRRALYPPRPSPSLPPSHTLTPPLPPPPPRPPGAATCSSKAL